MRQLVGSRCNGRLENSGRDFTYSCSTPENLNGDLHGTGFLSVDLPCSVNYLGSGGCELVAFRYASACTSKLVETAASRSSLCWNSSTESPDLYCGVAVIGSGDMLNLSFVS